MESRLDLATANMGLHGNVHSLGILTDHHDVDGQLKAVVLQMVRRVDETSVN